MPRPPSQRGLQAFRHTVLTGSVTGAAAVLGRTQPAISRLLKELEADIGFALFERVKGRMVPTPEGRLFFEELQRAFAGFERIASVAAEIRQGRRGTLRIAAMPAAAAHLLPRVVRRFTGANPGTAVALQVLPSADVARLVQTQDCDLGVVEGALSPPALATERRYAIPCAVVMPAGHPWPSAGAWGCATSRGRTSSRSPRTGRASASSSRPCWRARAWSAGPGWKPTSPTSSPPWCWRASA